MRSDLRLADLSEAKTPSKLMNVKVPDTLAAAIDAVATEVRCSKTAAVVALLNEGLDAFDKRRGELVSTPAGQRPRRGRPLKEQAE